MEFPPNTRPFARGFSLLEYKLLIAGAGLVASLAYSTFKTTANFDCTVELESKVIALNEAVTDFKHRGGNLQNADSVAEVLQLLSTPERPATPQQSFVSFAGELVPVMQSPDEAQSRQRRVHWDPENMSFRITEGGAPGAKHITLTETPKPSDRSDL